MKLNDTKIFSKFIHNFVWTFYLVKPEMNWILFAENISFTISNFWHLIWFKCPFENSNIDYDKIGFRCIDVVLVIYLNNQPYIVSKKEFLFTNHTWCLLIFYFFAVISIKKNIFTRPNHRLSFIITFIAIIQIFQITIN